MAETIIEQNIVDAYKEDMIIAAITVNRRQNVPDVRDGCKSVVRRILYDLFDKGWSWNKKYNKCAGIVGNTLERFHPHGDTALYDAMCGLVNWWDIKIPLIDGHGNYGNMQGEGAAHYRYTECRMSRFAEECVLAELNESKDVVDWQWNFNDTELEPEYLPTAVPLLLINGVLGIGVGMKTEIPRHNLGEVIDATIQLIRDPNAKIVLIPDHCMPVHIIDTNWKGICNSGNGKYKARAIIDIEMDDNIPKLVIKSVPDRTTLTSKKEGEGIISKIIEMSKEGKLPQIKDIRDETTKNDLRYVIELKKGSDPQYVKEYLYKHTLLEKGYTINFEVIDGIETRRYSYKSYIQYFIEFRKMVKFRTYCSLYQKNMTTLTEKSLYLKIMQCKDIDEIIGRIRKMKNVDKASKDAFREDLIRRYKVSDLEANFIMTMDVTKLAPGYIPIYQREAAQCQENIDNYIVKITDESSIEQEIIDELIDIKQRYATPRLCKVVKEKDDSDIPKGEFRIVITENNYIKKILVNDNINTYRGDSPKYTMIVDNRECILLFDKKGKAFKQPVWKIPICDKNSPGVDIRLLIRNCTSDIVAMMYEPYIIETSRKSIKHFLVVVTENNCIKKMGMDDFVSITPSGTTYTKLSDGDSVVDIAVVPDNLDVVIYSKHKALRVNMKDICHYKRTALGVVAMNTQDTIDGLSVIYPDVTHIVVTTKNGMVNRFDIAGLARSVRNRAGASVIKLSKTDSIVSIKGVAENQSLRFITATTQSDIPVNTIPVASSVSAGTKMFKESVIKVTQL